MRWVVWAMVGVSALGCFRPAVEIICDPGTAMPCDAGCAGIQTCNEAGNALSICECTSGVGGGGGGSELATGGGWQDIDLTPASRLDLGAVDFVAGSGTSVSGEVVIRNVGNRPVPADSAKNLLLGTPSWEVTAATGSKLSELCVGTFDAQSDSCIGALPADQYDPSMGLLADGVSAVRVPVRITPDGLGDRAFSLSIRSNDPDEPIVSVAIRVKSIVFPPCELEISPAALDFGVIAPPGYKELGAVLRNRLTGPDDFCSVSRIQLLPEVGTPPQSQAIFSLPDAVSQVVIAPGATHLVRVRASVQGPLPATATEVQGRLAFDVGDPMQPRREVPLTATVTTPCLLITPANHDFRTVSPGCSSIPRQFQIFNFCSTEAFIDSAVMLQSGGEFLLVQGIPPGARVLPDNQTPTVFAARYHPIDEAPDLGAVVLSVTQDGRSQRYVVPLAGTGDLAGHNTEVMIPGGTMGADVLLVIDDSCSMEDKQDALAANMTSFLQYATAQGIDFHLGVTNTELNGPTAAQAGLLRTSPSGRKFLTPSTPNLAAEFASLVRVGTTGYTESCMEPAMRALIPPYSIDPARNAGFLRDDALLAIVCVTDARDQASRPTSFYLDQLINVRGAQRQGQFTYNVIGPFLPAAPLNCAYDDPNDGRHDLLVRLTHGVKEEICSPNWAAKLTNIGTTTFGGNRDTVFLSSPADLSMGLVVRVDGVLVTEFDAQSMARHWTFNAATNSVTFAADFLPPLGSRVTVDYRALCVP